MSTNLDALTLAIQTKTPVACDYNGFYREMCPHVVGWKAGKLQVLSYQFAGQSSSGPIVPLSLDNWRCMEVEKIQNLKEITAEWQSYSPHSRPQTCVDEILAQVSDWPNEGS
jgi:hypothetical protein